MRSQVLMPRSIAPSAAVRSAGDGRSASGETVRAASGQRRPAMGEAKRSALGQRRPAVETAGLSYETGLRRFMG